MDTAELNDVFFDAVACSNYGKPVFNVSAGMTYSVTDDSGLRVTLGIVCGEGRVATVTKTEHSYIVDIPQPVCKVLNMSNCGLLTNVEIAKIIGHQYPNIGELYFAERLSS